ncbi:CueP family metal-binding protein [Virgibacillus sp. MSJ-26]|uniref:CueP family metal-binding protein n=1 Tax=Virgibacillus sp. MSJ-26 TaxID=2841522 RepID=UPI001C105B66|nr:CueP family metal-binding protein [Virgibacillus sp. MSJ-26]MBU5467601.1 CueP family metal-binding protein [Virgibacillus sp. MSJ-26]
MRLKITVILLVFSIFLVSCQQQSQNETSADNESLENIKELVNDYSIGELTGESASITSTQLIVSDNEENESIYDLPEDEFFVSIAPFISETHPCTDHSLTGCQGELDNEDFDVYIEDMDGNVIVDETMNSEANGFIDLWLPREEKYQVKITHEGKQVESEVSTFNNDRTCITTMQLS